MTANADAEKHFGAHRPLKQGTGPRRGNDGEQHAGRLQRPVAYDSRRPAILSSVCALGGELDIGTMHGRPSCRSTLPLAFFC